MPDRMWALRSAQFGKQSALHTAVAATMKMAGLMVDAGMEETNHDSGPGGELFDTLEEQGLDYSMLKFAGRPDYNEITWPFAMSMGNVAPTTPSGGTVGVSFQRIWTPPVDNIWTPMPATVETGDPERGEQFPDVIVSGFQLTSGMDKFEQSFDAFGGKMVDDHDLTASLSTLDEILIKGEHISLYLDTTNSFAGTPTKLTRYFEHQFGFSDIYAPDWAGDRGVSGYGLYVQKKPKSSGQLTLEGDDAGIGTLLPLRRVGGFAYLRFEAIGPEVEAGVNHSLVVDMAIKFQKPSNFKGVGETSGITGNDWPYTVVKDKAWTSVNASGQAIQFTLVNGTPAI